MAKVKIKNLLHQPLVLDFEKDYVLRLNAREVKEIDSKYLETAVFKRNEKDIQILTKPQAPKTQSSDTETK